MWHTGAHFTGNPVYQDLRDIRVVFCLWFSSIGLTVINAKTIPLDFWKDPQSDVILVYGEWECSVYFRCWSSAGEPADYIGHLSFKGAQAIRSFPREFLPYQVNQHGRSEILQVEDSDLARDYVDYRKRHYPQHPIQETKHYVVYGHDIYHEILAISFTAARIPKTEITDARLLSLVAAE